MMNQYEKEAFDAMYEACLNALGAYNYISDPLRLPGLDHCRKRVEEAIGLADASRIKVLYLTKSPNRRK